MHSEHTAVEDREDVRDIRSRRGEGVPRSQRVSARHRRVLVRQRGGDGGDGLERVPVLGRLLQRGALLHDDRGAGVQPVQDVLPGEQRGRHLGLHGPHVRRLPALVRPVPRGRAPVGQGRVPAVHELLRRAVGRHVRVLDDIAAVDKHRVRGLRRGVPAERFQHPVPGVRALLQRQFPALLRRRVHPDGVQLVRAHTVRRRHRAVLHGVQHTAANHRHGLRVDRLSSAVFALPRYLYLQLRVQGGFVRLLVHRAVLDFPCTKINVSNFFDNFARITLY